MGMIRLQVRRGSHVPSSILREDHVREIKAILAVCGRDRGILAKLAKQYGVGPTVIANIRDGRAWAHVRLTPR